MKFIITIAFSLFVIQTLNAEEKPATETKYDHAADKNEATVTITNQSMRQMPIQRGEPMGGESIQDGFRDRDEFNAKIPQQKTN
ncbi:MAG TPA: hypothetical protein DD827_10035 [Gammaproteobacteria bacterium]|jgi:hypothetical protein|nr:hypothetical protein [Gammaproteobacteria bacterium]